MEKIINVIKLIVDFEKCYFYYSVHGFFDKTILESILVNIRDYQDYMCPVRWLLRDEVANISIIIKEKMTGYIILHSQSLVQFAQFHPYKRVKFRYK